MQLLSYVHSTAALNAVSAVLQFIVQLGSTAFMYNNGIMVDVMFVHMIHVYTRMLLKKPDAVKYIIAEYLSSKECSGQI